MEPVPAPRRAVGGEPIGAGLTNVEYAPLAERMGRSLIASEVCNCNAPDTGNMEVLLHFGSDEQRERWLGPLLEGTIRSAFCMTEPEVASSDATNMQATAVLEGEEVVLNGRKWWSTGMGHPACEVLIFMGLTDPEADRYHQHSMVLVPAGQPGREGGADAHHDGLSDAPGGHGEVSFEDVRLPASAIVGGAGQAFAIAQARLGPGRIHHCMRLIGLAELALRAGLRARGRARGFRQAAGQPRRQPRARSPTRGSRSTRRACACCTPPGWWTPARPEALGAVSQIKVAVPNMAQQVVDMAIQLHGGAGLSEDFPLGAAWTIARALRLADGPDEVHRGVVARLELARHGIGRWAS